MPEEDSKVSNVRYGIKNAYYGVVGADGSYDFVGVVVDEPVLLSSDECDETSQSYYQDLRDGFSETFEVKAAWWQINRWAKVFGLRVPYLVANLRRGGKSHRGKARPLWRER